MVWKQVVELVVSYGFAGFLFAIATHYLIAGQLIPALGFAIAGGMAVLLSGLIKAVLEQVQEMVKPAIAEWIVQQLTTLWWRLTSNFHLTYYQSLIYAYRDYRTQGIKTRGPFTLDLENVFVPLSVAPESFEKISSAMLQFKEQNEHRQIWDFLTATSTQPSFRRMVVIARPGSGKTTLLEHLALTYAQRVQWRHHRRAPKLIPIMLYLRDVRGAIDGRSPPNLADLLHQQDGIRKLNPPPGWFATCLQQGSCLVMLDGLDEVADLAQRQAVSRWVDQQMGDYPNNTFILTSRPFGYRSAPLTNAGLVLEIQPFTLEQMGQFIHNWYLQTEVMSRLGRNDAGVRALAQERSQDLITRIQYNPPLVAMAINPLLLTMIATVHNYRGTLPGRRVDLYAEICDVLLGRRQEAKGLPTDRLTALQKRSALQVLALNRMRKKTTEFSPLAAGLVIQEKLVAIAADSLDPLDFLQQVENISGLIMEVHPGVYSFAHKSLMEYLAAVQIKEANQEFILTRHIDDPWWEETIRLYAAQSDASNLIWAALQKFTVSTLTLAYECLEEGLSVGDRQIRQQLEEALVAGLISTDEKIFKLAAEVKLSRRLRQLVRIDENREIDTTPITCAEYQLFLDDYGKGKPMAPEHVSQPITQVTTRDAEAFCQWLTQRAGMLGDTFLVDGSPVFVGDSRFRLPTESEIQDYPMAEPGAIHLVRERVQRRRSP